MNVVWKVRLAKQRFTFTIPDFPDQQPNYSRFKYTIISTKILVLIINHQ